jgi:hypothetical protein
MYAHKRPFEAIGGLRREVAIDLLKRFYAQENVNGNGSNWLSSPVNQNGMRSR